MTEIARQTTPRRVADLTDGANIRSDLGSQEELARLGASLAKRQDTPLLILEDGTVIDGHRRLAAARLAGIEYLDCIVVPDGATPEDCRLIQWRCAVHKKDISPYDKALAVRDTRDGHPEMTNQQIAALLDIDAPLLTRYLSLFDRCNVETQEAARAGMIGLSDWYAIAQAPDQMKALDMALKGATRQQIADASRRERNGHAQAVRVARMRIPLATDAATGTVTLAGDDLDLESADALLKEAGRAIKAARDKNLDPKTAQAVWRDMAKGA